MPALGASSAPGQPLGLWFNPCLLSWAFGHHWEEQECWSIRGLHPAGHWHLEQPGLAALRSPCGGGGKGKVETQSPTPWQHQEPAKPLICNLPLPRFSNEAVLFVPKSHPRAGEHEVIAHGVDFTAPARALARGCFCHQFPTSSHKADRSRVPTTPLPGISFPGQDLQLARHPHRPASGRRRVIRV